MARDSLELNTQEKIIQYENLLSALSANGKFLVDYSSLLLNSNDIANITKANKYLLKAKESFITYYSIELLAKSYFQIGNYKEAYTYCRWLKNFTPNLITPKFNLFAICLLNDDLKEAKMIGEEIENFKPKEMSVEVVRMKLETKRLLDSLNSHAVPKKK
jgi:tetratricopeptide (TPR) repeat protein